MKTSSAAVPCVTIIGALFCLLYCSDAAPTCDNLPYVPAENCVYGVIEDWCHRDTCAKGPGESCGGFWMHMGQCASGTYCLCDKCTGCATANLKCYHGDIC